MNIQEVSKFFKEEIFKEGFFDLSIIGIPDLKDEKTKFREWLKKGYHGNMHYLERNLNIRFQPESIMPDTKSIITVLLNYFPEKKLSFNKNYRISKYAYGKDYHVVIKSKLNSIAQKAKERFGDFSHRSFTDSAPLPDRLLAKIGGLGSIGKNTLLIHPEHGSYFFIGHLFLDIELETTTKEMVSDLCLGCDKCLKACPTNALLEPYLMDATKCLSYQTIENTKAEKDISPQKFRSYIYGCDICQDVCPHNKSPLPHQIDEFQPNQMLLNMKQKEEWENLQPMEFGDMFRGSAVKRAGYKGLMQNINWINKS